MSNKTALVFGGLRGIGAGSVNSLDANGFDDAYIYFSAKLEAASSPMPGSMCCPRRLQISRPVVFGSSSTSI